MSGCPHRHGGGSLIGVHEVRLRAEARATYALVLRVVAAFALAKGGFVFDAVPAPADSMLEF